MSNLMKKIMALILGTLLFSGCASSRMNTAGNVGIGVATGAAFQSGCLYLLKPEDNLNLACLVLSTVTGVVLMSASEQLSRDPNVHSYYEKSIGVGIGATAVIGVTKSFK